MSDDWKTGILQFRLRWDRSRASGAAAPTRRDHGAGTRSAGLSRSRLWVNLIKIPAESLLILLRIYKVAVSPVLTAMLGPMGLGCRYTPTCSDYARSAIREHGAIRGMGMTLGRLARCHPWGGWGDDPVPPAGNRVDSKTCCHHGS